MSQNIQYYECQACGERIGVQPSDFGQGMGSYHHCNGKPSIDTIRRIIREEIEAALKRAAVTVSEVQK